MSELDRILEDLEGGYDDAIAAMEAGNAEAADYILQGLGMSMDEREKWFDVAVDALQPVIQYGKQYEPDARRFMNYASELVFNPDAIYGTEMWAALKGQMTEAVTNSAAAKSGLLSGNYLDELSKRTMVLGADFRNQEINNALNGFNAAMVPVSAGLNAQGRIGDYAMNVGSGNAADISNSYMGLGSLSGNLAANIGQAHIARASDLANANLADQLAQRNERSGFLNSLVGAAGTILGGGDFLPWAADKVRKSTYDPSNYANALLSFAGGGDSSSQYGMGGNFIPGLKW